MPELYPARAEAEMIPKLALYKFATTVLRVALPVMGGARAHNLAVFDPLAGQPVLVASEHNAGIDPVVVDQSIYRHAKRPVHELAKRELFEFPPLGWLISSLGAIPVDRNMGTGLTGPSKQRADEIIAGNGILLNFITGTRIKSFDRSKVKKTVGRLGLEHGAAIVPASIAGNDKRLKLPRAVVFGEVINPRLNHDVGSAQYEIELKDLMDTICDQIIAGHKDALAYLAE